MYDQAAEFTATTLASVQMSELVERNTLTIEAMREIMTATHGGSDHEGTWIWREAYDAAEAGLLLALKRKFGGEGSDLPSLKVVEDWSGRIPTQTRRSEDQIRFQQFSTPLPLALCAAGAFAQEKQLRRPIL